MSKQYFVLKNLAKIKLIIVVNGKGSFISFVL